MKRWENWNLPGNRTWEYGRNTGNAVCKFGMGNLAKKHTVVGNQKYNMKFTNLVS